MLETSLFRELYYMENFNLLFWKLVNQRKETFVLPFPWSEVKATQSCPTLCVPMDYTVQGILQAKILE